ncbi:hypothetical protein BGZ75_003232 [Mortierella antarctica]|nr:hypothetical protein BGZ67_002221 [Mortierella alpina]KAF9985212.1 hypothetical protein BGZ75_003232 [Mortierella antarctica]
MKYRRQYRALAIMAVVALAGSIALTSTTTDAAPVVNSVIAPHQQELQPAAAVGPGIQQLRKRQKGLPLEPEPSAPRPKPAPTAEPSADPKPSEKPEPQPSKAPQPPPPAPQPKPTNPNPNPPAPKPSAHEPKTSGSHSSTGTHSDSTAAVVPSGTDTETLPTDAPSSGDGSGGVPTKVSSNVWIGLGTVSGLLVFALGGVAFCRHRRKKNLATALLQQTAQFNHNNPYAKLSEPGMAAKESLPMTPTKPLGTYSVVATYQPALADEIEIGLGDSVTILQEYDDGWCLGVNNTRNGIKGVFPRHCLEGHYDDAHYGGSVNGGGGGGGGGPGYYPPNNGFKAMANKRMSSIPAGGWNSGPPGGYNNGYADYPPNPVYNNNMGPNHGPPGQGYYNNGY